MRVLVQVERDAAMAIAEIEGIEARAEDARSAFERIADSFIRMEKRQFATQGAYGATPWEPLSPHYAEWKARHFPGKPVMQRTGVLYRSLTGGPGFVRFVVGNQAIFGTSVEYAGFHQAGTGRLPRRPVVPDVIPPAVRGAWTRILRAHVLNEAPGVFE